MTYTDSSQRAQVFWKTGTSHGFRDAWSVAVFDHYVLAVWVGNFDGKSNPAFVGRSCAAPLLFQVVDAMRAKDPKIQAVAVGALGEWDKTMLANAPSHMSYMSEHVYWQDKPDVPAHVAQAVASIKIKPDGLNNDLHASPEYRAHLITVMCKRAVEQALK